MKGTKTLLSYILFIIGYQYKPICCLPEPPCESDHFQCQNMECVPNFWKCDGQDDCGDNSDESSDLCSATTHPDHGDCDEGEMKCNNNRCIDADWRCDGEDDCGDSTDERNCSISTSSRPEVRVCDESINFRCGTGKCIPRAWTCNNVDDCGDNSDESNTTDPNCVPFVGCRDTHFHCEKSNLCIHKVLVCDMTHNCGKDKNGTIDTSDESGCASRTCEPSELKCDNGRCVSKQWRCDKQDDCGDSSDERNCSTTACPNGDFKCVQSGHCISGRYKCDGYFDCLDGTDERGCSASSTTSPLKPTTSKPYTVVSRRDSKTTTSAPTKVYTTAAVCSSHHYTCKDGKTCLHRTWVCDGEVDCPGMDDESADVCSSHKCESNHFKCDNGKCISMRNHCDRIDHCGDNSDEKNCDSVNVPCTSETHKCRGSSKCIPQTSVCDGKKDCHYADDDESSKCGVNECLSNNGNCPHVCIDLPIGHKCECSRGHEYEAVSKKCLDINECHVFGKCSQSCVNYKGSFACLCDKGYTMDPLDNRTCRAGGPPSYLVFTNRYDVREMSSDGRQAKLVVAARSASALAVSYAEKMLYWADNGLKTISRALMDGTGKTDVIVSNVEKPEGLALDWLGEKLYWTDTSENHISVSNLDGTNQKVVVEGVDGYDIKAIEVYPEKGYIFWTSWGIHSEILRAHLDGTNQSVVFGNSPDLNWPTHLALDKTNERLYWSQMSTICSIDINGNGFKRVVYGLTRPYGLAVFEDHVYWTDFVEKAIYRANKFNGQDKHKFEGNYTSPGDIAVYHPLLQTTAEHPCRHDNGGCSHLCFLTPTGNRVCACPGVMTLNGDGKTCSGAITTATPKLATTVSITTTKGKTTKGVLPTTENVPLTTVGVPETTKVVPVLTTAVPATTKGVPATIKVIPETTIAVPETTRFIPETPRAVPEKGKPSTKAPHVETTKLVVPVTKKEIVTEKMETESPEVIFVDDVNDDDSTGEQKSNNVHIIVTVVCVASLAIFVVFAIICFRRKRKQFDLSMVYESQRDVVHEKDEEDKIEKDVETKYIILPSAKKSKTFDNINFNNVDESVRIPLNLTTDIMDNYSGSDHSSDDVCFDDDAPIIQNMV